MGVAYFGQVAGGLGIVLACDAAGADYLTWVAGLLDGGNVISTIALFLNFGSLLAGLILLSLKTGMENREGSKQQAFEAGRLKQAEA